MAVSYPGGLSLSTREAILRGASLDYTGKHDNYD